ncbi:hypothetical protein CFP56_000246 [Quercus suber]|uniref:Uncharacterized protein n=1 Tax=Quercus suber TaxID=58331 RepID=A0AAW0MFV1_QUESU
MDNENRATSSSSSSSNSSAFSFISKGCYDFVFCASDSIPSGGDQFREEALTETFRVSTSVLVVKFQQEGSGKVDSEVVASDRFVSNKERDCGGGRGCGWSC